MSLLLLALALATASASGPTYARSRAFAPAAMPKYSALFAVEPAESPAAVPVLPGAAGARPAQAWPCFAGCLHVELPCSLGQCPWKPGMLAHLHARRCPASQVVAANALVPAGSYVARLYCKTQTYGQQSGTQMKAAHWAQVSGSCTQTLCTRHDGSVREAVGPAHKP